MGPNNKNLKVLVINVCLRPYSPHIMFPLGLSYIASAIHRAGYDLEILDLDRNRKTEEEIKAYLQEGDFDVVAFGCIVTGYKIVKKLSKLIREIKRQAIIIAGNSVADSIPQVLLEKTEVDIAVISEGDVTIVKTLETLENSAPLKEVEGIWYKKEGKIFKNSPREVIKDMDSIPFPVWELFDMEAYVEAGKELVNDPLPMPKEKVRPFMINTARGCPFRCSFCYQVFRAYGYRHRSVDSVISEIKELQKRFGINYIFFFDDLSFPIKVHWEEFADRISSAGLKFYWTGVCRCNLFNSEDDLTLLKKIKKSGCIGFVYALESASRDILKAMNKGISPEDFAKQKRLFDKVGLASWTSLVFGYPQETKETIKETLDLCYEVGVYPSSGFLLPQPRTPMYDYIFEKGIVNDEEEYLLGLGDRQDLRINLTKMSDKELQEEVDKHLERISHKLNLGLNKDNLIKTTAYKSGVQQES